MTMPTTLKDRANILPLVYAGGVSKTIDPAIEKAWPTILTAAREAALLGKAKESAPTRGNWQREGEHGSREAMGNKRHPSPFGIADDVGIHPTNVENNAGVRADGHEKCPRECDMFLLGAGSKQHDPPDRGNCIRCHKERSPELQAVGGVSEQQDRRPRKCKDGNRQQLSMVRLVPKRLDDEWQEPSHRSEVHVGTAVQDDCQMSQCPARVWAMVRWLLQKEETDSTYCRNMSLGPSPGQGAVWA